MSQTRNVWNWIIIIEKASASVDTRNKRVDGVLCVATLFFRSLLLFRVLQTAKIEITTWICISNFVCQIWLNVWRYFASGCFCLIVNFFFAPFHILLFICTRIFLGRSTKNRNGSFVKTEAFLFEMKNNSPREHRPCGKCKTGMSGRCFYGWWMNEWNFSFNGWCLCSTMDWEVEIISN